MKRNSILLGLLLICMAATAGGIAAATSGMEVPQELAQRCFDLLPPDFQEIIVRHFNNR